MMYDDARMSGYYQPTVSLWPESGHWKMEPTSPPSPPPPVPSSPFVDLDTDSWFAQDGGGLAATNVHNQQNSSNLLEQQQHHHYYAAACESPDLIVPDTSAANYGGGGDVTQKFHLDDVIAKPATRGEAAQKLLNDLDEWIKEEPFSDWYEEKIDLPIFEELETVQPTPALATAPLITRRSDVPALLCHNTKMASAGVQQHYAKMASPGGVQYAKMAAAATPIPVALIGGGGGAAPQPSLMQEFDFVLSHHHQEQNMLTPPESPERVGAVEGAGMTMLQNMPTEELDELVRIRVESLVEGGEDSQCSSYSPSAGDEECFSSSGSEGGRSPSPSLEDSSCGSDPEWSPHSSATKSDAKQTAAGGPAATQSKRRRQSGAGKPYQRPPPEEKRQRKKEQNKNAATRYRLKKKAEIEEILGEERGLIDRNQQLKTDVGELQREIKYLKSLMREMLRRKKVIK